MSPFFITRVLLSSLLQYLSSILSLTENLRKCAEFGENFAKALKDASDEEMQALMNAVRPQSPSTCLIFSRFTE